MQWGVSLIVFVLICAGAYAGARYQLGHKAAARRLPIVFVGLAAGIGVLYALHRLVPPEWEDHAWSGFFLVSSLFFLVPMVLLVRQSAQAGHILLEIGRPRGALAMGIMTAGGFLFSGIGSIIQVLANSNADAARQIRYISAGLLFFSGAVYFLFFWLSKWSIRERGIVLYGQLLPWQKIEAFQWDDDKPTTLVLSVKRRSPWWRTISVPIPAERREAATEILGRCIPSNSEGGTAG